MRHISFINHGGRESQISGEVSFAFAFGAESDGESADEREEVLLFESDSEDDSDSERKLEPKEPRELREVPDIDPRIDQSLSEIVVGIISQSHVLQFLLVEFPPTVIRAICKMQCNASASAGQSRNFWKGVDLYHVP